MKKKILKFSAFSSSRPSQVFDLLKFSDFSCSRTSHVLSLLKFSTFTFPKLLFPSLVFSIHIPSLRGMIEIWLISYVAYYVYDFLFLCCFCLLFFYGLNIFIYSITLFCKNANYHSHTFNKVFFF